MLHYAPWSTEQALRWAMLTFDALYNKEITELLREHPEGSLDAEAEDGRPFWGG